MKTKVTVSIDDELVARVSARRERKAASFSQRWRGKFHAAVRNGERYKILAKRYL